MFKKNKNVVENGGEQMTNEGRQERTVNKTALHAGGYSLIITAVVIAIIIAVNFMVSALPAAYTSVDMSSGQFYSISSNTKVQLGELESEVTIYWLVQDGAEDDILDILLQRYEALSDHITVEKINPDENPTFTDSYDDEDLTADLEYEEEGYLNNSLIVQCGEKYRYLSYYNDIYVIESTIDYNTYQTTSTITGFDGEGAITSAINYVTHDDFPKMYVLSGHGEEDLPSDFADRLEKENIEVEELSLIAQTSDEDEDTDAEGTEEDASETEDSETEDAETEESDAETEEADAADDEDLSLDLTTDIEVNDIPEDADIIMIYAPTSDVTSDEAEKLMEFAEAGGNIMVAAGVTEDPDFENLNSILAYYGVGVTEGVVCEIESSYYVSSPAYLLPVYGETDITTSLSEDGYSVIFPLAYGMTIGSSSSATEIISTSGDAFCKAAGLSSTTVEKEDGDTDGPFSLGVKIETTGGGQIVWFSSSYFLYGDFDSYSSGANIDMAVNALTGMTGETESLSIPVKSATTTYLTISDSQKAILMIVVIGIIPAAFLAFGIIVVVTRRMRQK